MRLAAAAASLAAAAGLAACGGNSDDGSGCTGGTNKLVVGSATFQESKIVGDIYAEALRANGFTVDTKLGIGSRDAYIPALRQCSVSVVPDYTGNLLQYLDKSAAATSGSDIEAALTTALGDHLAMGKAAPAEDSDAVVVTRATAEKWNLKTIADLVPHAAEVTFAAPTGFEERPGGLPGLTKNYGLGIAAARFVPVGGDNSAAAVQALTSGQAIAADIYTTSPAIKQNNLVVLEDPKHNFAAQNVVPLLNTRKKSDKAIRVLNAVSAKLTTAELRSLNDATSGPRNTDPATVAKTWIDAQGLNKPVG
ncbi:ABC transporter substrate-binding protein [Nocardia sp. NPDC051570]|uniref:ABC transporter substrate-binding protein n=1 Tax=Nocardia sp. NPDC051570 TaxID=3364324 RepID=UPI0037BBB9AE